MEKAIRIQLGGKKGDVHRLAFALFGQELPIKRDREVDGKVNIMIESEVERELVKRENQAFVPWTLDIQVKTSDKSEISRFASWFCDEWREKVGNMVEVEVDHSPCVCDPELLEKAIKDSK